MRVGAKHMSPNLLEFTDFLPIRRNSGKALDGVGGDKLWTENLKKLNCYIRENPGEMAAF
jgi:hypothetical protein